MVQPSGIRPTLLSFLSSRRTFSTFDRGKTATGAARLPGVSHLACTPFVKSAAPPHAEADFMEIRLSSFGRKPA